MKPHLSRRESEIMDIVYRLGKVSATKVREAMVDPPSNSTVRSLLGILEEKGHLEHHREGKSYVYRPTLGRIRARKTALSHLLRTFFDDSPAQVVAALLKERMSEISDEEYEDLKVLIAETREEGR